MGIGHLLENDDVAADAVIRKHVAMSAGLRGLINEYRYAFEGARGRERVADRVAFLASNQQFEEAARSVMGMGGNSDAARGRNAIAERLRAALRHERVRSL